MLLRRGGEKDKAVWQKAEPGFPPGSVCSAVRGKAEDRCFYLRDFVEAVQRAVAGLYGVTYTTISFLQKPGTKHPSIIEEFIEEFVEENK